MNKLGTVKTKLFFETGKCLEFFWKYEVVKQCDKLSC